ERRDRPGLESARTPVRNRRSDHEAIVVSEIGHDGDRSEIVDRPQWRARNLDPDMHGINEVGGVVEGEACLRRIRPAADPQQELGFGLSKTAVENRYFHFAPVALRDTPRK